MKLDFEGPCHFRLCCALVVHANNFAINQITTKSLTHSDHEAFLGPGAEGVISTGETIPMPLLWAVDRLARTDNPAFVFTVVKQDFILKQQRL